MDSDYVKVAQASGRTNLFPELTRTSNGYGGAVSNWFRRRLEQVGAKSHKKVFHSFRHTVQTRLARAGVSEPVIDDLVGYSKDHRMSRRYIQSADLETLSQAVERLDFRTSLAGLEK